MSETLSSEQKYAFEKYSELIEQYASMNTSYDTVGVVLHNTITGERAKIRNPVYEQVRNLRGNQPKLQYQYLSLRKEGRVKDFLQFYPENKKEFSSFRDQLHLFTDTLYLNYVSCYIKKSKPLIEFSQQYRTHMFNIHKIYTDELREKKLFVNNTVVIKYVNNLHPSLLMYCLNLSPVIFMSFIRILFSCLNLVHKSVDDSTFSLLVVSIFCPHQSSKREILDATNCVVSESNIPLNSSSIN